MESHWASLTMDLEGIAWQSIILIQTKGMSHRSEVHNHKVLLW